jgi:hypothetical protein
MNNIQINADPLNQNNFMINGASNAFKQKNALEKILTNFNDSLIPGFINYFNTSDIPLFLPDIVMSANFDGVWDNNNNNNNEIIDMLNHHINNLNDQYILKIVIAGGKSLNYHLPTQYIKSADIPNGIEPEDYHGTNIISFDYDLHIGIFDLDAEEFVELGEIITNINNNIHQNYINMNFFNYIMNIFLNAAPPNYGINLVLRNYFDNRINNQPLGKMFIVYLNNVFNTFNDHPDNIVNGEKLFTIDNYNDDDDIVLECINMGGVHRLTIPISYTLDHIAGISNYLDMYFAFADIEWDIRFPLFTNFWEPYYNNILEDGGYNIPANLFPVYINNIDLLKIDNLYVLPLDICILNTLMFSHKRGYNQFKKRKNYLKLKKIEDKLRNEDNILDINLNTRYWDKSDLSTNEFRYVIDIALRLSSDLFNAPPGNSILIKLLNKINVISNVNNNLHTIDQDEYFTSDVNNDNNYFNIRDENIYQICDLLNNDPPIQGIFNTKFLQINNKVFLQDHDNNNPLNVTFDGNNVNLINFKDDFGNYVTIKINSNYDINNAITNWMGGNYRFINYTLTCNHYGINNYLNDIPAPEPFNSNDVEEWINNIDLIFNQPDLPITQNQLMNVNHPRHNILADPEVVNILNLFNDNNNAPNWFLTYRCTRYFNINNMMIADHNNVEFMNGQVFVSTTLTSTSYSPYINWHFFQDLEQPFYVFEFILNGNERGKFLFLDNLNGASNLEKEVLLKDNLRFMILKIDTSNILIKHNNKQKIRTKYAITVIVLTEEQVEMVEEQGIHIDNVNDTLIDIDSMISRRNTVTGKKDIKKGGGYTDNFMNIMSVLGTLKFKDIRKKLKYLNNSNNKVQSKIKKNSTSDKDLQNRNYSLNNQSDIFYQKYKKYKNKYLELKKLLKK